MNIQHNYIADFWSLKGVEIHCSLCPHACVLKDGDIGFCRTRRNIEGQLILLVYGYPCALHIDPVEKKPLFHFFPGSSTYSLSTTGCNLRCLNCQNYSISQIDFNAEKYKYFAPELIVKEALQNGCTSISYTYTDPIVYYEYARDIAVIARDKGLKNIIVSAGYINPKPLREWCKVIDAANIDLKSFSNSTYKKVSQITLNPVLHTLELLKEEGVWLEITNLLIPGYTDDLNNLKKMCSWLSRNGFENVPLHFSRFFPVYKMQNVQPTSVELMKSVWQIAKDEGLKYIYIGNVNLPDYSATYCANCGERLISRMGFWSDVSLVEQNKCPGCGTELEGYY